VNEKSAATGDAKQNTQGAKKKNTFMWIRSQWTLSKEGCYYL